MRALALVLHCVCVIVFAATPFAQPAKPTMKAIVVHEYGGPEVLKYEDLPRPEPNEDQILIRVIAAGVNPVDAGILSGKYAKFFGITLPFIPGYDIAGVVEKTGAQITKSTPSQPKSRLRPNRNQSILSKRPVCQWSH
jgi:NADPH:quinone reductase-like Zn-dependent oxidoreductase